MKRYLSFSWKTLLATVLGAALFAVLFLYAKIPTGFPEVEIQSAYGIGAFLAAIFGPIAGGLIGFLGHAASDVCQGTMWWSWITASTIALFVTGLVAPRLNIRKGEGSVKDILLFNAYQVIGNLIAWCIVAPALDVLFYAEPADYVFTQGIWAAIPNILSAGVIGTVLLVLYDKIFSLGADTVKFTH